MLIEVSFHELVKKINVWNRGEGLGMARVGSVGGPTENDNTVGWQAGNCYIFVDTWDKSTTLVELHLINAEEPANDRAIRTWGELHRLIAKEYQEMSGSLELGESSTDASGRAWYEYKLKANFEGFETELDQFITAYSESELETIELSPWQNLIENRFIERIVVPRNHERVRILSIRFRFRDRASKGLTTEEGDITLLVSYIGATDGYNLLLTVLPGFLRAKPFVESWISRCKLVWAAIPLDTTTVGQLGIHRDTLVTERMELAAGNGETDNELELAKRAKELGIKPHRLKRWDRIKRLLGTLTNKQIAEREGVEEQTIKKDKRDMTAKGYLS